MTHLDVGGIERNLLENSHDEFGLVASLAESGDILNTTNSYGDPLNAGNSLLSAESMVNESF